MSYDLTIWCVRPFTSPDALTDLGKRSLDGDGWSIEGRGWQLNAGPSEGVLPEDIPEEIASLLPGIEHVVQLSLEPAQAPATAMKTLRKAAKAIAQASHGAIFDPQDDSVELPSGVQRFVSPKRQTEVRASVIEMGWWFDHARLLERASLEELLSILRELLPEALPRRYGPHEPPQFELEKTGEGHLLQFLTNHLSERVVWYPKPPVSHVWLSLRSSCGWQNMGHKSLYRCNHLYLNVDSAVLDQPGWQSALLRTWKRLSIFLSPFYGDVRTATGYIRSPRGLKSDGFRKPSPTSSWWWKGIPLQLGHAVVLGEPYARLWPEFAQSAENVGGLRFASNPDWRTGEDLTERVGAVPSSIALPFMPYEGSSPGGGRTSFYPEDYPASFPFGARPA